MATDMNTMKRIRKILIAASFVSVLLGGLYISNVVGAICDSSVGNKGCKDQNFLDIQKVAPNITPEQYQQVVDGCDATWRVGTGWKGEATLGTEQGNCSNAVRSCFLHENNVEACTNAHVIAVIATVNNGDVDAGGERGIDGAIALVNEVEKTLFISNTDQYKAYLKSQQEAACDDADLYPLPSDRVTCRSRVELQLGDCLIAEGGIASRTDTNKINECMRKYAQNEKQCTLSVGSWIPAGTPRGDNGGQVSSKGECTPLAAAEPCYGHGGGQPDANGNCPDGSKPDEAACLQNATQTGCAGTITGGTKTCGQASTNIIGCGSDQGATALNNVLRIFVIVLTFGVGIAATGSIAYSAIRYAGARDNQSDVSLARERIRNVVIGLLLYGFLIAIANWLVPGGIF